MAITNISYYLRKCKSHLNLPCSITKSSQGERHLAARHLAAFLRFGGLWRGFAAGPGTGRKAGLGAEKGACRGDSGNLSVITCGAGEK